MGKKKLQGYVYSNGLWYRLYKNIREVCSEKEVNDYCKLVEAERERSEQ